MEDTFESRKKSEEDIYNVHLLISSLLEMNPNIDYSLWISGFWYGIINWYIHEDIPYQEFCEDIDKIKEFYRTYFGK